MTSKATPSRLLLLLPELQLEILSHLPFIDQFSISKTCTALRACILAFRSSRYLPVPTKYPGIHMPDPSGPQTQDIKAHFLLRSDRHTSTDRAHFFCTMQAGVVKRYFYAPYDPSLFQYQGYIWNGKGVGPGLRLHGSFASLDHLDFGDIWDPKALLEEQKGEEEEGRFHGLRKGWIMFPILTVHVSVVRNVRDITDSPFLDEPCFLRR
ncbi:hypothetical protein TWF481_010621 [Arthrobotrys musiformis]|uniref:F-box domain-containing protein n=1 Tax=Arthrobotrys musiformis TaxID=47236 RepID=A0AAV9W1B8_9PEZI